MTPSSADPSSGGTGVNGVALQPGNRHGQVLKLDVPLSFWGGTSQSGRIIDRHHPQYGESIAARVLVMTSGRGSSSSSSVLAEQLRAGYGPAAVLLAEPDAIVVLGAIVAHELYGAETPVVLLDRRAYEQVPTSGVLHVTADDAHASVRWEAPEAGRTRSG